MNYDEFKEYVVDNVLKYCPPDFSATIIKISKNNNTKLDGLVLRGPNDALAPTVYVGEYYFKYINNDSTLEDILSDMADESLANRIDKKPSFDKIFNSENIKNNIYYRLCGIENNQDNLANRPHKIFNQNLAIVYQLRVNDPAFLDIKKGEGTIALDNNLMRKFNLTADELHQYAEKNTPELFPAKFTSMNDIIIDILTDSDMSDEEVEAIKENIGITDDGLMYVLTNEQKINGAAVLLYPNFLKDISEKFGGTDFYVLPSSVHEVIILPHTENYEVKELREMVESVNCNEVLPEEVLSNSVYKYDHNAQELHLVKEESHYKTENRNIDMSIVLGKIFVTNQKAIATQGLEL